MNYFIKLYVILQVHTGRSYVWDHYDNNFKLNKKRYDDKYKFLAALSPDIDCTYLYVPNEKQRKQIFDEGYSLQEINDEKNNIFEVIATFYFPALRKKIEQLIFETFFIFETGTPEESQKLEDLIMKVSLTRFPAPENGG